jgi:hypothetical protein
MSRDREGAGVVAAYLAFIDEAFNRRAWHGTTLRGSLRGVSAGQAAWRPRRDRHNIWEIAVHAAYWKYAVTRRLAGGRRGSFPLKGSNWFARPQEMSEAAWAQDIRLLESQHHALRDAVAALDPAALVRKPDGSAVTLAFLVRGIAAHDLYHAGQIQLLKRLAAVTT